MEEEVVSENRVLLEDEQEVDNNKVRIRDEEDSDGKADFNVKLILIL